MMREDDYNRPRWDYFSSTRLDFPIVSVFVNPKLLLNSSVVWRHECMAAYYDSDFIWEEHAAEAGTTHEDTIN